MSHRLASPAITGRSLSMRQTGSKIKQMMLADYPQDQSDHILVIRPNRSLTWRGTMIFYIAVSTVALVVAVMFAMKGAWLILPFAGLEIFVLGVCLYICARKNTEYEVIHIGKEVVKVERGRRRPDRSVEFQRYWTQVRLTKNRLAWYPSRLTLGSRGHEVEIGSTLLEEERVELTKELQRKLTN